MSELLRDEIDEKEGSPGLSHWIDSLRVTIDEEEEGEEVDADISMESSKWIHVGVVTDDGSSEQVSEAIVVT